jgi:hypothetical protein
MNTISQSGLTYPKNITISWSAITQACNGGDVPFYYEVSWYNLDLKTPAWQVLTTDSLGLYLTYTHIRTIPFTPGQMQTYRVRP